MKGFVLLKFALCFELSWDLLQSSKEETQGEQRDLSQPSCFSTLKIKLNIARSLGDSLKLH